MPYVPGYDYDVFVSYAHVDNKPMIAGDPESEWVSSLIEKLKTLLAQKLGRDVAKVWRDPALEGHAPITPEISKAIAASGTLLLILSEGWLASDWCRRELSLFIESLREKGGTGAATSKRIFVVARSDIERERWPDAVRDQPGYTFHAREGSGYSRTLGVPKFDPDDKIYVRSLDDLSRELASRLKALAAGNPAGQERAPESPASPAPARADGGPAVYLAEVPDDMFELWEQVQRQLKQANIAVFPEESYNRGRADFEAAMQRDLEKCHVFAQLLGPRPMRRYKELPEGYVGLQYELAVKAKKPLMRWRALDTKVADVADESYRKMLSSEDVVAQSIETFKSELAKKAKSLAARVADPEKTVANSNDYLLVTTDPGDMSLAGRVAGILDRIVDVYGLGYEVMNSELKVEDLSDTATCRGLMVLYGAASADHVRIQLRRCRQIISRAKERISAYGVCHGPPAPKEPLLFHIAGMDTLESESDEFEEQLKAFVSKAVQRR